MNYHSDLPQTGYVTPTWLKNYLKISNSTMHAWIVSGFLPRPHRIGVRAMRFSAESVRQFLEDRTQGDVKLSSNKAEGL